jgi:hypothetical protein
MRFHKAVAITGPEAAYLIENNRGSGGRAAVVSCEGTWYDVRSLTAKELESFIDDLARTRQSRISTPTN